MSRFRLGAVLLIVLTCVVSSATAQSAGWFPPRPFSPDAVFQAFNRAYPGRFERRSPFEAPAIGLAGKVFLWAEGRLLPQSRLGDWSAYAPQSFYEYPRDVPDVNLWTEARAAEAEARLADRQAANLKRDPEFFDALWGISNLRTADAAQRKVKFLGLAVTVHKDIREALGRVEAKLTQHRREDPTLDAFLRGLSRLEGYHWRDIAGTQSRSNHAYGTAIDVIPRSYGGKNPYWLWAAQDTPGWYRQSWNRRWKPHPALVKAFEDEGFVWGGKWLMFDTIHFEYRPELLILNGLR